MTKSELKSIIKECVDEILEENNLPNEVGKNDYDDLPDEVGDNDYDDLPDEVDDNGKPVYKYKHDADHNHLDLHRRRIM